MHEWRVHIFFGGSIAGQTCKAAYLDTPSRQAHKRCLEPAFVGCASLRRARLSSLSNFRYAKYTETTVRHLIRHINQYHHHRGSMSFTSFSHCANMFRGVLGGSGGAVTVWTSHTGHGVYGPFYGNLEAANFPVILSEGREKVCFLDDIGKVSLRGKKVPAKSRSAELEV